MNTNQRSVEINGSKVTFLPWEHDNNSYEYDYTNHISLIHKTINELEDKGLPKIICIEGETGSGKSVLAKVLQSLNNEYIYVDQINGVVSTKDKFTSSDIANKFIIDEVSDIDKEVLKITLKEHAKKGSTIILLCQSILNLGIHDLEEHYSSFNQITDNIVLNPIYRFFKQIRKKKHYIPFQKSKGHIEPFPVYKILEIDRNKLIEKV